MSPNAVIVVVLSSCLSFYVSSFKVFPGISTKLEKRSKRGLNGLFDIDSYIMNGFGRDYEFDADPNNALYAPEVPVYIGTDGNHAELLDPFDEEFNIFQDGNSVVGISRRNGRNGRKEDHLNGIISKDGDEYVIQPNWYAPDWSDSYSMDNTLDWPYHTLRKRNDRSEEADVDYVIPPASVMSRTRRGQRAVNAVIELLVVVDNVIYRDELKKQKNNERRALQAIRNHYNVLVSMTSLRYGDINNPGLKISVRLAGMYIAKDRLSAPWAEYNIRRSRSHPGQVAIDPQKSLDDFRRWLDRNKGKLPAHDHAMAFTGYSMENRVSGAETRGMAYISTICMTSGGWSSSIVEEYGGFSNVGTVTHELGHSLGAYHDGTGKNKRCRIQDNYVMAPYGTLSISKQRNSFMFSQCSIRSFIASLSSPRAQCLSNTRAPQVTAVRPQLPGQILGADAQCREVYGERSSFCNMPGFREQLCIRLWCRMPSDPSRCLTRAQLAAAHGTTCGNNMWCKMGHCTADRNAPPMGECFYGDEDPGYCQTVIREDRGACQNSQTRLSCCRSCANRPIEK